MAGQFREPVLGKTPHLARARRINRCHARPTRKKRTLSKDRTRTHQRHMDICMLIFRVRTEMPTFYKVKRTVPGALLDEDLAFDHWKWMHERAQGSPVRHTKLALQCIAGIACADSLGKGLNIKMNGAGELCLHGRTKIPKL